MKKAKESLKKNFKTNDNLKPYKSHIPYTKHQITNEDIKSVEKILKSNFYNRPTK